MYSLILYSLTMNVQGTCPRFLYDSWAYIQACVALL